LCFSCYCVFFRRQAVQMPPQRDTFYVDDDAFYHYLDISRALDVVIRNDIDRMIVNMYILGDDVACIAEQFSMSRHEVYRRLKKICKKIVKFLEK